MRIGIKLRQSYKLVVISTGLVVGLLTVGSSLSSQVFAQSGKSGPSSHEKVVSVFDKGQEKIFVTKASTVRQALQVAKIDISEDRDVVEPSLDHELVSSKYSINIYRARPITVVEDSFRKRVITAEQSPVQIAKSAGLSLDDKDKAEFSSPDNLLLDGADVMMIIQRATEVKLMLYGKPVVVKTHQPTVASMLDELGIKLTDSDYLSVDSKAKLTKDLDIRLWRNGEQTMSIDEVIDFETEKIRDSSRPIGYREVKTPGKAGLRSVSYQVVMQSGVELSRREVASAVINQPVKQIEIVGTSSSGGLTQSKGVFQFKDSRGVTHRETYYDLPMRIVMGHCGAGGHYTTREDGVKIDAAGFVIIAAHLGNYPRCSVVETSLGAGKVYDTGSFTSVHPHGFDIATDWTNPNGI